MIFESWWGLLRVVLVAPLGYGGLVLILRVSGKRTLAKLNAFDFVVTVALGSILATILLSKTVPLLEGLTGLIMLAAMQFVVAWLSVRISWFSNLMRSEPTLLLHNGVFLDRALTAQRVTRGDVKAALRSSGVGEASEASTVVLETDGSISVIKASAAAP
jgi:uncharacterized membrane protein YcaP (DUF421 family)